DPDNDRLFTWWAPWRQMREKNIGWRLDYILASPPLADAARSAVVERTFGTSDHAPVTAVFDVRVPALAPGEDERAAPARKGQLTLFGTGAGGL
ncbi:MAG TPA: endonuclease/exonuclease/phosphatase family protein, partial [Vicinamibacteria bacterium]|nr:endonuclease/exonuclease/phosphatase family protein [Vicinamibacteria bacterium]